MQTSFLDEPPTLEPIARRAADEPPTLEPLESPAPRPHVRSSNPPPSRPVKAAGWQSPLFALFLALLLPGAGQAYNGQPIKGFFLFFFSVLVLPWFYSLYDAYVVAAQIKATGGSSGCSGFLWVGLQFWLGCNTALLVVLILTISGVLT